MTALAYYFTTVHEKKEQADKELQAQIRYFIFLLKLLSNYIDTTEVAKAYRKNAMTCVRTMPK